jgi:hypothetical protein
MPVTLPEHVQSIGISGTRDPMSSDQEHAFFDLIIQGLRAGATELHHGACTGADAFAHYHMATQAIVTHVHPPTDKKFSAEDFLLRHPRRVDHEAKSYTDRNGDIAEACTILIAAPRYPEDDVKSKRSGTWQTVRKAHSLGKPVFIADYEGNQYQYEPKAAAK